MPGYEAGFRDALDVAEELASAGRSTQEIRRSLAAVRERARRLRAEQIILGQPSRVRGRV